MTDHPTAPSRRLRQLQRWSGARHALLAVLLPLLLWAGSVQAAAMAPSGDGHYRCDGDPLRVSLNPGAVDASGIPNSNGGTVPGAFVVLEWRGLQLQLPRTNNAGPPSYTDGRWWWQASDGDHPTFAERRGAITRFACEPEA